MTVTSDHECPGCGEKRVDRQGTDVWECDSCSYTFAGGAYSPETPAGKTVTRSIRAALDQYSGVRCPSCGHRVLRKERSRDSKEADVT